MTKTTLKLAVQARSPEREKLASALDRLRAAVKRQNAIETAYLPAAEASWRADAAVEEAEKTVKVAQDNESSHIVAEILGERPGGMSVEEARSALDVAEQGLAAACKVRVALEDESKTAKQEKDTAQWLFELAFGDAVREDSATTSLLAEYEAAQRRVVELHSALSLVSLSLPNGWDSHRHREVDPATADCWRAALASLRENPDASLPGA